MKIKQSEIIKDLVIYTPEINYDYRGEYIETFNKQNYYLPKGVEFVQDDISVSTRGVIRGVHGDFKTWKLIQWLYGKIILGVVDMRKDSNTFGNVKEFVLSEKNRCQILVPAGCGNGHSCLSNECIFSYKQSEYYGGKGEQFTILYNSLNINWGVQNPI